MKTTLKKSLMALLCVIGVNSFVACTDKGETTEVNKITAGNYSGTMSYTVEGATEVKGASVDWSVAETSATSGSINFAKFPVRDIIVAIIGENDADGIVEMIGPVTYSVKYNSVATKSDIALNFTPEPLIIKAEGLMVIVTVETPAAGNYNIATKGMDFQLKATAVKVNDVAMTDFKAITLRFSTKK